MKTDFIVTDHGILSHGKPVLHCSRQGYSEFFCRLRAARYNCKHWGKTSPMSSRKDYYSKEDSKAAEDAARKIELEIIQKYLESIK